MRNLKPYKGFSDSRRFPDVHAVILTKWEICGAEGRLFNEIVWRSTFLPFLSS